MALQTTGAISFSDINDEFGKWTTEPISLGDTEVRNLFGQTSGSVSINNAYNKTAPYFNLNVTSSIAASYDLYGEAVTAGWNEIQKLSLTINSNGWIQGGLEIVGSFQRGVKIINDGHISGTGGKGGDRGYFKHYKNDTHPYYDQAAHQRVSVTTGQPGGNAMTVNCTRQGLNNLTAEGVVEIVNNGTLSGGGGGGGASNWSFFVNTYPRQYFCYDSNGSFYYIYGTYWFVFMQVGSAGGGGQGLNGQGGGPAVGNYNSANYPSTTGNIEMFSMNWEQGYTMINGVCTNIQIPYVRATGNLSEASAGTVNGPGEPNQGENGGGGTGGTWGQAGSNGTNAGGGAGGKTIYVTTGEVTIDLNTGTYNGTTYGL